MKKILLLLVLVGTMTSCGTTQNINSTINDKTEVVMTGKDKNENFVLANEWMVESFNSAKSIIQFTDKEEGIVKGKYLLLSGISLYHTKDIYAIITIRVKDGAAKIEIKPLTKTLTAIKYNGYTGMVYANSTVGYTSTQYDKNVEDLFSSFKFRMNQQIEKF